MGMDRASSQMTPCEYIRMANDLVQGDSLTDKLIREYLAKAELLAKEMSKELHNYDRRYWHRFPQNKDYESDLEFRKSKAYKYEKV